MTITANRQNRSKSKYFVYYNDWTGEIISVGTSLRNNTPALYFETVDDTARQIIHGEISDQNYIVSSDPQFRRLIYKNDILHLRKKEEDLIVVQHKHNDDWTIRIKLYKANNRLVFEANQAMISRLVAHNIKQQIKLEVATTFQFYMVQKDRPDYLIETITFDAEELINRGRVVFDISDIPRHTNFNNISILTHRYFENYYVKVLDESYIDVIAKQQSVIPKRFWQTTVDDSQAHLQFLQTGNCVSVTSLVSAEKLSQIGLNSHKMIFFVVGETPDHYISNLEVDISRLRVGQNEQFVVDFDIESINLIHCNPRLHTIKRKAL